MNTLITSTHAIEYDKLAIVCERHRTEKTRIVLVNLEQPGLLGDAVQGEVDALPSRYHEKRAVQVHFHAFKSETKVDAAKVTVLKSIFKVNLMEI